MLGMNQKLRKLEEEGNSIRVGIVGAGQMGKGMVSQIQLMKGMVPSVVADVVLDNAKNALLHANIPESAIKVAKTLKEANEYIEKDYYIVTDDSEIVSGVGMLDAVVDATGVPDVGAKVAMDTILSGKHIVMLNVETDVVIGPWLKKLADSAGVVYTGSAGDEPGAVKEMYDFADALGFEIRVIGKGKNNAVDYACTPDSAAEEAASKNMSPKMLTAFKDGTKTMVEMTAMSNATGFVPGQRGAYGIKASKADLTNVLPQTYSLKSEGGMLDKYGIVDYVDGIAPGVFIVVTSALPEVLAEMQYLKMGDGPNYVLYRPYHMCSLETPLSIAKAVIDNQSTIVPMGGLISETTTIAKKDLKAGEALDGIGGYTVYGTIETVEDAKKNNSLPLGLINKKAIMLKDAKKGQLITRDMVQLDEDSLIYRLRALQDQFIG